jgi:hypothetical protein
MMQISDYDIRHGGPFDRGMSDSYYQRSRQPHYFVGDSYTTEKVEQVNMSADQIAEYNAGFDWNEQFGDTKEW